MRPLAVRPYWEKHRLKDSDGNRSLGPKDEWEVAYSINAVRVFLSELRVLAQELSRVKSWRESFNNRVSKSRGAQNARDEDLARIRKNIVRLKKLKQKKGRKPGE
jgi:hypothetical protein